MAVPVTHLDLRDRFCRLEYENGLAPQDSPMFAKLHRHYPVLGSGSECSRIP